MTREQIDIVACGGCAQNGIRPELVETHISWVIICDHCVYKIKKPVKYSFLDFSTLAKRKYYCEREIELNKRLTDDIYIDILPVKETSGNFLIGGEKGVVVDYAVRMRKLDRENQMNILIMNNKITNEDIKRLAEKIAAFHRTAKIIGVKDIMDVQRNFNDLEPEKNYLKQHFAASSDIITNAILTSDAFIKRNETLLFKRLKAGFFRDCHGDLHSRNIFILPNPEPFDCIEFNDNFREIDVLNEVAFLCMDLDAFNRKDLSDLFFNSYNSLFTAAKTREDYQLFVYYKSYRANIRAKVNSLRARSPGDDMQRKMSLNEAGKYLQLMDGYLKRLPDHRIAL
jgi:aminoglycoside phosphotransferase family enzyme